ncbi:MAG: tetratricopeptide repeat protein [Gemmatimonadetes bacterium]|nr:tetratricopeptide repeat protein [Gemmatimonadota bacterium]MBT7861105.1 tetratricopeptide repeat protein [Gemmatimonadota bacterium]
MVVGSLVLLVLLALLSLQRSQIWADDLQLWQDAVTTGPMMPRAQLYLGDAHLRALETGDTAHRASARRAYEQVLALKPRQQMLSMQAGNGLAWLDLSEGRLSEALLRLEAIVADSPGYCDAWVNLGSAHYQAGLQGQSGALEKALHAYDRALGLRPGRWEAHLNRGAVLQVTGRLDEAEEAYRHAIRLMPTQSGAAMNLGGLFMLRARLATDLNQRIRHWQQARGAYQQAALLGNPVAVRAIQATQDSMASNRGGAR